MTASTTSDPQTPAAPALTPRRLWGGLGVALLLLAWWLLAAVSSDLVVASPLQTLTGLVGLLLTAEFWIHTGITMARFCLSLALGGVAGLTLGMAAGIEPRVKWLLAPMHWVLMTMPPVVLVMLAMIWFGMGSVQTVFVTALLIFPMVYANTRAGIEAIDPGLLRMARVYHAGRMQRLRHIYLPGIYPTLFAALTLATGMGIRIVVLAEVLGAADGIGYAFSLTRTNMDTPALFGWIVVCLIIGGGLDGMLFSPLKAHVLRWREGA